LILPTDVSIYQVAEVIAVYSQDAEAVECVRNAINEPFSAMTGVDGKFVEKKKIWGSGRSGAVALETYRREQIRNASKIYLTFNNDPALTVEQFKGIVVNGGDMPCRYSRQYFTPSCTNGLVLDYVNKVESHSVVPLTWSVIRPVSLPPSPRLIAQWRTNPGCSKRNEDRATLTDP
jgi:hypothetical protein